MISGNYSNNVAAIRYAVYSVLRKGSGDAWNHDNALDYLREVFTAA